MRIKNKGGAEKIMVIYWFTILVLVAGGISAMVYSYYSHPIDVREIEARVLSNSIADCLSQDGRLNPELFNETTGEFVEEFNALEKCNVNFNVEDEFDWKATSEYYVDVKFYSVGGNLLFSFLEGNNAIRGHCEELKEEEDFEKLPRCLSRGVYGVDINNKQVLVDIFTGVRKTEKNAKM